LGREGKWFVHNWFIRDVSARVSKSWPPMLRRIIQDTKDMNGILAMATVDRMLRNAHDFLTVRDSGTPILICENDYIDTTTPRGRNTFGKMVLDAETEAEEGSVRVFRES